MSAADPTVLAQNLANYATEWSASEYTREAGFRPDERALISEFFPPAPANVLDIGCGAGRTTIGLSIAGYAPVAIDLSAPLLTLARARYPQLDFRDMDATALAFGDCSFDAALFSYNGIDCIYPVAAREQCLREVFRVLKPGAPLIFSSHNAVGAMFSGGYFYLAGYFNAWRMLALQRGNPRLREWYFLYLDAGGPQILVLRAAAADHRPARADGVRPCGRARCLRRESRTPRALEGAARALRRPAPGPVISQTLAGRIKRMLLATQQYRRVLGRTVLPGVAVLGYHGLRPDGLGPGAVPFENLHVTASTFEAHCRLLRDTCHPISLDDWRAARSGGNPLPARPVLITFDDGYRSVATIAAPALKRYGLPAVVFACSEPIANRRLLWFDAVASRAGEAAVDAWKMRDYEELAPRVRGVFAGGGRRRSAGGDDGAGAAGAE